MAVSKRAAHSKKTPRSTSSKAPASSPPPKALPPALVKNAAKLAAAKRARLAAEGRADIELIRARRARIVEDFYDIGEALLRLKRPGVAEAVGHAGFLELCRAELDMSPSKANQLIAVVNAIPREQARELGQERASALVALAHATPEQDSATALARGTLKLPSGKKLDVPKATTRQIRDAAKTVRQAKAPSSEKPRRGTSTTPDERAQAAALEKALHARGIDDARVTAVARAGAGALVRIERVPLAKLEVLGKILTDAKGPRRK